MSEINLTYCPEGGEHEWQVWQDDDNAELIIDCDRCHQEAWRGAFHTDQILIFPLPVKLDKKYKARAIEVDPRHQV